MLTAGGLFAAIRSTAGTIFRWPSGAQRTFGMPTAVGNDCDVAGLAEARFGAGRGRRVLFYVTVGSGIGGGLIVDGQIYRGNGVAAAEIGHLRPGLHADRPDETVESMASGWGIAAAAQSRLAEPMLHPLPPLGEPVLAGGRKIAATADGGRGSGRRVCRRSCWPGPTESRNI